MPILGIQIIEFLIVSLLAPRAFAYSKCSCKCSFDTTKKSGYACDLINKLQTSDDTNVKKIEVLVNDNVEFKERLHNLFPEYTTTNTEKRISELEGTVNNLKSSIKEVEERLSKKSKAAADQRKKLRDEIGTLQTAAEESGLERISLSAKLKSVENESQKSKKELSLKIQQLENMVHELNEEITANKAEDHRRTSGFKKEFLKRVEGVEMLTLESKKEVLGRMKEAENKLSETDRLVLMQIKEVLDVLPELSQKIQKVTTSLITEQRISDNLQAKMEEIQKTVSFLPLFQSEVKDEIRKNMSLTAESLKAYIEDRLTELKHMGGNLTSKIKHFENIIQRFQYELENCASISRLSELDTVVRNQENFSNAEHQSLRTELSLRVKNVEEKCAPYEDIAEMNMTLTNLTTEMNGILSHFNKNQKKQMVSKCIDSYPSGYCKRIIETNHCTSEYSATHCCASCAKAGQLPPNRTNDKYRMT